MIKTRITTFVFSLLFFNLFSQSYTSYFTGDTTDVTTTPLGGICMMGGASENDEAMKWFLERSNGGDILVMRASGSDGYNNYLFSELGITVNSVETIVFDNIQATSEDYVITQIQNAEAIWFAGGDQWDYVSYWRGNQISEVINQNIQNKNIVIGGTSAGMAILGGIYFTAEFGTIHSNTALENPFNDNLTISNEAFITLPFLNNTITDTHYDSPDRKGRHLTFLARAMKDWNVDAKGIACDEYTSVCIDTNGKAYVYGSYPTFDDNAYFLQVNCTLPNVPEKCEMGEPLNWVRNNAAVKVYRIKGESTGNKYLDLNNWEEGDGGIWENWYVENGVLTTEIGEAINCSATSVSQIDESNLSLYPNPISDGFLTIENSTSLIQKIEILDATGKAIFSKKIKQYNYNIDFSDYSKGIFFVKIWIDNLFYTKKIIW